VLLVLCTLNPFSDRESRISDPKSSMFLATIPAVLWVDQVGRKPVLVSGAFLMGA
jgi:hypothetical protein